MKGTVEGRPDDGCCCHGALVRKEDGKRLEAAVKTLTDDYWQFRKKGLGRRVTSRWTSMDEKPNLRTRKYRGARIFLNRPGFKAGIGCALHTKAIQARCRAAGR